MTQPAQVVLIFVIAALTILILIIGVQVFFILTEFRKSAQKLNQVLDNATKISDSVTNALTSLGNSFSGLSGIAGLFGWLARRKKSDEK